MYSVYDITGAYDICVFQGDCMILPEPMTCVCFRVLYNITGTYDVCVFQVGYMILPVPMTFVCFRTVI